MKMHFILITLISSSVTITILLDTRYLRARIIQMYTLTLTGINRSSVNLVQHVDYLRQPELGFIPERRLLTGFASAALID